MDTTLDKKIEALLFWKSEPVDFKTLSKVFNTNQEDVVSALEILSNRLDNSGIRLVIKDDEAVLVTIPEIGPVIESLTKEEFNKELSKASVETLSIIIYRGPIKRSEIDYIRGVNSQFILRNLLVRGLIEKVIDPKDERAFLYKASIELLNYLGLAKVEDAPEFEIVNSDIEAFLNKDQAENEQAK